MRRDWAEFRRCLALPNSAHKNAGLFTTMLFHLNYLDHKPNQPAAAYEICHTLLLTALFSARNGILTDTKRRCMWALNVNPAQLPALSSLPSGIDHVRCITTHGPTWTFSQPGAFMTRKLDIRTPRGRLEILDMVSHVSKARGRRELRPKAGERRALRERTLLHNARNVGRATTTNAKGGGADCKTHGDGDIDGAGSGLVGVAGGG